MFYVSGGKYQTTQFDILVEGCTIDIHGPFETYDTAEDKWNEMSWKNIDDCHVKYRIINQEEYNNLHF